MDQHRLIRLSSRAVYSKHYSRKQGKWTRQTDVKSRAVNPVGRIEWMSVCLRRRVSVTGSCQDSGFCQDKKYSPVYSAWAQLLKDCLCGEIFLHWTSIRTNQECFSALVWIKAKNLLPLYRPARPISRSQSQRLSDSTNQRRTGSTMRPTQRQWLFSHDKRPSCSLFCQVWLQCLVYGMVKMHCAIEGETLTVTWAGGGPSTPDRTDPTFSLLNNRAETLIPAGRSALRASGRRPAALLALAESQQYLHLRSERQESFTLLSAALPWVCLDHSVCFNCERLLPFISRCRRSSRSRWFKWIMKTFRRDEGLTALNCSDGSSLTSFCCSEWWLVQQC